MLKNDVHLQNLIRKVRESLLDNKPIQAFEWLRDLEKYIYKEYGSEKN